MDEQSETNLALLKELSILRQKVRDLEKSETERKRTEDALRKSEEKYRFLMENMVDMVWTLDMNLQTTYVSPSISKVLGFSAEERKNQILTDMIPPESLKQIMEKFTLEMERDEKPGVDPNRTISVELEYYHKDGSTIWFENVMKIIRDGHGNPTGVHGVSRKIERRKKAEQALRESEAKYRLLIEESPDPIFSFTSEGRYKYVNRAFAQGIGKPVGQILNKTLWDVLPKNEADKRFKALSEVFRTGKGKVFEVRMPRSDSDRHYVTTITPINDNERTVVSVICSSKDITDRKKAEEALMESERRYRELSIIDDLTKLYNSRHFFDQLKIEIDRANRYGLPLTMLLIDIDDFKHFNDSYGHIEGDQVLLKLGQIVKRCLRRSDTAYRYGGEEFTALLPMTIGKSGIATADRIRNEFKKTNFSPLAGHEVHITVSMGIGQYRAREDIKAFVHRIDQLMYRAKNDGKNRICFESWTQEEFKW